MNLLHKMTIMAYAVSTLLQTSAAAQVGSASPHDDQPAEIPTGQVITPTAGQGALFQDLNPGHLAAPEMRADQAAAVAVSPDGRTLAILTSGFNIHWSADAKIIPDELGGPDLHKIIPELSTEYIFLYDVTGSQPRQIQVLGVPNTYQGLAWAPFSDKIYVSGGVDDSVLEYVHWGASFTRARTFRLGHKAGIGLDAQPEAGGISVSPDGTRLLVSNLQNDSVSLIDLQSGTVIAEQDLRPGKIDPKHRGEPGGTFPRAVVWTSNTRAYIGSVRDREILSLAVFRGKTHSARIQVIRRLPVRGQPTALLANQDGSRLYVALDNADHVLIFDTIHDRILEAVDAVAPKSLYANSEKLLGANSNALALTPDGHTLLVSNGGENALAVVRLSGQARASSTHGSKGKKRQDRDDEDDHGPPATRDSSAVIGLIPTGWYPTGVATSKDGAFWYVINGKHEPGPNTLRCKIDSIQRVCPGLNEIPWQLEKAGFLTLPAPSPRELARLTKQVARNNHFDHPEISAEDERLFAFLRDHIKHVIYIIKENRTYDQVLGDLEIGNGDPRLTLFPERLAPNHHALARNFVTLDNFLVTGEGSATGWDWSVSARTNDFTEREDPLRIAHRGLDYNQEGANRNINMGIATSSERHAEFPNSPEDPDVLPGTRDVAESDGPEGEVGRGYLWDAALGSGKTIRNWGFFGDFYGIAHATPPIPLLHDPHSEHVRVFFPTKASLIPYSDPYFRGFDPSFPDFWRVQEWKREFAQFSRAKSAPNLMLVRIGNDHFGNFARAIDGVNAVETQMADNDYALGMIVEAVEHSPFASDTLIISVEDDASDGMDHVDRDRSIALFAGPYVRQHALVSTRYTTVSLVKTIEEILGLDPMGLNDSLAAPIADIFDPAITSWSYEAIVPDVLRSTRLPLPPDEHAKIEYPKHSAHYWTKAMAGQDFSEADHIEPGSFNRALWRGLKGATPYRVVTRLRKATQSGAQ
jgi:DNA-binding beta-propeller fold protein YncE